MADNPPHLNRHLTGLLALACLVAGIGIAYGDSPENIWCGTFIRTGVMMVALWVALPTRGRAAAWANVSPWWIVALVALLVVLVRRPLVLLPIVAGIVVLMAFLPRGKRR